MGSNQEKDNQGIIERLTKAIQCETISHQNLEKIKEDEFLKFHDFLRKSFPLIHKKLEVQVINKLSLLYKWEGSKDDVDSYLFAAHMDVAPIDEESKEKWTVDPFSGLKDEKYIWGRGTLDMKSHLMGIMEAVELLLAEGKDTEKTIYIAIGHDEEVGGLNGAAKISSYLKKKGVRISAVIDEGGFILKGLLKGVNKPIAAIGTAEKGYLTLELMADGDGGHSSAPGKESVINRIALAINKLQKKQFPAKIDGPTKDFLMNVKSEMSLAIRIALSNLWLFKFPILKVLEKSKSTNALIRTTTAFTMINGGIKENVIPDKATAMINFRIMPLETIDKVILRVKELVKEYNVTVRECEHYNPSEISDSNTHEFRAISSVLRDINSDIIVSPYLTVGITDSRHYQQISDNIYRFSPIEINPDSLESIHGINERISIEDYRRVVEYFYKLIKILGGARNE